MTVKTENTGASDFDKLVSEITDTASTVAKAMADGCDKDKDKEGDANIEAAAEDGDADGAEDDAEAGEAGKKGVAKSFKVTLDDGSETEAFDGTELIKSLTARAEKAEGALTNMFSIVKSMQSDVAALKAVPRGRKSVVTVSERPAPGAAKSTDGMTGGDFIAKSWEAYQEKKIDGFTLSKIESQINKGIQPDAETVRAVLGK